MMVAQVLTIITKKIYRVSKNEPWNAVVRRPPGGWKNWPLKPAYLSPKFFTPIFELYALLHVVLHDLEELDVPVIDRPEAIGSADLLLVCTNGNDTCEMFRDTYVRYQLP